MWPLPYECKNKVLFSKASLRNIRQKLASLSSILGTHVARTKQDGFHLQRKDYRAMMNCVSMKCRDKEETLFRNKKLATITK